MEALLQKRQELVSSIRDMSKEYELLEVSRKYETDNAIKNKQRKDSYDMNSKIQEMKREMKQLLKTIEIESLVSNEKIAQYRGKFSETEWRVLVSGIDSTDYKGQRFIDINTVVKQIDEVKLHYPNFVLENLCISMTLDTYPPENNYEYCFSDNHGFTFKIGYVTVTHN